MRVLRREGGRGEQREGRRRREGAGRKRLKGADLVDVDAVGVAHHSVPETPKAMVRFKSSSLAVWA